MPLHKAPLIAPAAPKPASPVPTHSHSCVRCQQRKVRCDKTTPCSNCAKAKVDCQFIAPKAPRRRKKKLDAEDLVQQVKKYEQLLSQHSIAFEPVDVAPATIGAAGEASEKDDSATEQSLSESFAIKKDMSPPGVKPSLNEDYKQAFKLFEGDAYRPGAEKATIQKAWDATFEGEDEFPFTAVSSPRIPLAERHPSGIQIFQLWQVYITNVDPLLKIGNCAELQKQIVQASTDLTKASKELQAQLFNIYFVSVMSLPGDAVKDIFKQDKVDVLKDLFSAAQQALLEAGFMRNPTLGMLHAFLLYLLCSKTLHPPRSLYCLMGIAIRMAQCIGLHRDGASFDIKPYEVEQRRRMWWNLVVLEKRLSERCGSPATALSTPSADCKRPLNINDSDLHVDAKNPPKASQYATDMIFPLTRFELAAESPPDGSHLVPVLKGSVSEAWSDMSGPGVLPKHTQREQTALDRYCNYVELKYLAKCDVSVPLHFFTIMVTRQHFCKLQLLSEIKRVTAPDSALGAAERHWLFTEAIRMVEFDNVIQSSEKCRNYKWYMDHYFPMVGYMFLINEVRQTRTGQLCERAWASMDENHRLRGMAMALKSPLHVAFGKYFMQIWDLRETALRQLGQRVQVPQFISLLRQQAGVVGPSVDVPQHHTQAQDLATAGANINMEEFGNTSLYDFEYDGFQTDLNNALQQYGFDFDFFGMPNL